MDDLKALSDAATQRKWWAGMGSLGECFIAQDNRWWWKGGKVADLNCLPFEERAPTAELICCLVNAYRSGDLVPAAAIEAARAEERERCAKIAEEHRPKDMWEATECGADYSMAARHIADAIRAGGET